MPNDYRGHIANGVRFKVIVDNCDVLPNAKRLLASGVSFSVDMVEGGSQVAEERCWEIGVDPEFAAFLMAGLEVTF